MNYKFLLNALLIIIIIHFIISFFLNGSENKGTLEEPEEEPVNESEGEEEEFNNMKNELVKHISASPEHESIKPGNYYATNENTPNFASENANLDQHFVTNDFQHQSAVDYDRGNMMSKHTSVMRKKAQIDSPMHQPAFTNHMSNVRFRDSNWEYQNESILNGGLFGGLVGVDSLETQYALFEPNQSTVNQQISTTNLGDHACNVLNPPLKDETPRFKTEDDLRFGRSKHVQLSKDYRVGGAV